MAFDKSSMNKWDNASKIYDLMNMGVDWRFGKYKHQLFSTAKGKILLVAVGTGLDFQYFSPNSKIIGIDISSKMLEKAQIKVYKSLLDVELKQMDARKLEFEDNTFDTAVTSCTFCSVPDPIQCLKEIRRTLKPAGRLLMFEHVRSEIFWMGPMMDALTIISRKFGPDLNRRTGGNIKKAGFKLLREVNIYLDIVKIFEALKDI